jgi:ABC-2 type transport system permease protein
MLMRILRHERRLLAADRTTRLLVALFALIVGYGVYDGAAWVRRQEATLAEAVADQDRRLDELRDESARAGAGDLASGPFNDPRNPSVVGGSRGQRFALAPPGPLAALCVGQADLYPSYYRMSNRSKQTFINNDEIENPANLLAGRFDLGFVIVYLFPLLVLALSYNMLSAEREQGTLAMTLAQPVRLRSLVAGKVLARLALAMALAVGLSVAGGLLAGIDLSRGDAAARLALWVGTVSAYAAFWFALAASVNALGMGSAANAVVLTSCWMLLVVVTPALVNVAATTLYPVPSRVELIQSMREASTEASLRGSNLLSQFYEDHPDLAPPDKDPNPADFMVTFQAVQASVDRSIEPVLGRYDKQLARQQALVDRVRFASPAIIVQEALNDVCGVGLARHKHFLEQVDAYHKEWQEFFVPRIMRRELLSSADFDAIPAFRYREEPLAPIFGRIVEGLAGLLAPAAALAALGLWALRRHPVVA